MKINVTAEVDLSDIYQDWDNCYTIDDYIKDEIKATVLREVRASPQIRALALDIGNKVVSAVIADPILEQSIIEAVSAKAKEFLVTRVGKDIKGRLK